ncbi:MAG: S8/S53 family peptidase [Bryobacterales bacterium]|nr:S8/S53 family peptidase [Bryobacterales bacterium]
MPVSEIYNSKFLIRIPDDHPNYEAHVRRIIELIRPCGLKTIEVFWPVGIPLLQKPEPECSERKVWDLGPLSDAFQRKARGRLLANFDNPNGATRALEILNRKAPEPVKPLPIGKQPPPEDRHELISGREIPGPIPPDPPLPGPPPPPDPEPLWPKKLLNPPSDWLKYSLNNIAVLDSGCDVSHPTFRAYGKTGDPSRVHVMGNSTDLSGHGSFVCGQIVGRGASKNLPNNHGLLPKSSIWMGNVAVPMSAEFAFPTDAGVYDLALNLLTMKGASEYRAAGLHRFNIQVLNLSLGGKDRCAIEEESIRAVVDSGIAVVACVHNVLDSMQGWKWPLFFPAALDTVVSVAAVDHKSTLWPRSRTAAVQGYQRSRMPMVDICAPGVSILSALPGGAAGRRMGTSFAAPYVTAAMAVLRAANPKLSVAEATATLLSNVIPDSGRNDPTYGAGILQCSGLKLRSKTR